MDIQALYCFIRVQRSYSWPYRRSVYVMLKKAGHTERVNGNVPLHVHP